MPKTRHSLLALTALATLLLTGCSATSTTNAGPPSLSVKQQIKVCTDRTMAAGEMQYPGLKKLDKSKYEGIEKNVKNNCIKNQKANPAAFKTQQEQVLTTSTPTPSTKK
jgi:hypothetical protein